MRPQRRRGQSEAAGTYHGHKTHVKREMDTIRSGVGRAVGKGSYAARIVKRAISGRARKRTGKWSVPRPRFTYMDAPGR